MASDEIAAQLRRVELFHDLQPVQIDAIAGCAERVTFRAGDIISETGVAADAALLIVNGAAEWLDDAMVESPREPIELGSLIGEMAMFIDYVYGATIVANGPVKCLRIGREEMHELMLADPEIAQALTIKIASRLNRLAAELRDIDAEFDDVQFRLGDDAGRENTIERVALN